MEIRNFSDCEKCAHTDVCRFIKEYQDAMDNIEHMDMNQMWIEVDCHCRHFKQISTSIK